MVLLLVCVLWALHHQWDVWLSLQSEHVIPHCGFVLVAQCDIYWDRSCLSHLPPRAAPTIPLQPGILQWALPQLCAQPLCRHSSACITAILSAMLLQKHTEPMPRAERAGEKATSFHTPAPTAPDRLPDTAGVCMGKGKHPRVPYPGPFSYAECEPCWVGGSGEPGSASPSTG